MANWYRYDFKIGDRTVHSGITTDPQRRATEHKQRWGNGHMEVIGGPVSEETARRWEESKHKTITPDPNKPKKK